MKSAKIAELDFAKGGGLIPVVTQEASTGEVLMVAYANLEALFKGEADGGAKARLPGPGDKPVTERPASR